MKNAESGMVQQSRSAQLGQDLVEYGLLLAFVSLAAVGIVIVAGGAIATFWGLIADQIATWPI